MDLQKARVSTRRSRRTRISLALLLAGIAWGSHSRGAEADWVGAADCPPPVSEACPPNPHVVPSSPEHQLPSAQSDPASPLPSEEVEANSNSDAAIPPTPSDSSSNVDADAANTAAPEPITPQENNANFDRVDTSDFQSSFASAQSSFSSAPTVIGDFAGGGFAQFNSSITHTFNRYALGTSGSQPVFDLVPGGGINPDVLSYGPGLDGSGDNSIDTFGISEPFPPTDAPLSPGLGFVFQGGTAVFTGNQTDTTPQNGIYANGSIWYLSYSYEQTLGAGNGSGAPVFPVPSPGVSVRRIKIAENFSPDVRNRFFLNFSFFNDAFGGLGDISRYTLGTERIMVDDLASVEFRLPLAGTYASDQDVARNQRRDLEIGNLSLIGKVVLLRTDSCLWSGGLGVGTPTADDTRIRSRGTDMIQIENQTAMLQPFTAILVRHNEWIAQVASQLDIAAGGDSVLVNTNLNNPVEGQLNKVGEFVDSTLLHLDFSLHRVLFDNPRASRLSTIVANAELHYTATLEDSDIVSGNDFTYTNLQPNFNIVNATFGTHLVMGRKRDIILTPAVSIPLRDGLDEQFDYEAIVQLNYLR